VFLPETRDIYVEGWGPVLYDKPIQWHQLDYLRIFGALNQHVWGDNLNDWKIYLMNFNADCQNPSGFWDGEIIFYKTVFDEGRFKYVTRDILAEPKYLSVAWGETRFSPPLFGWNGFDSTKLKVTADDALRIAEENGGKEARLTNKCINVSLFLLPGDSQRWEVHYKNFKISIDPYTGEVVK